MERVLKDDAVEEKGERARMASFIGAMAIADLIKTTLGPKGMDKILQSTGRGRNVTVTNDGATILKSLHIDNPAAKVLVDISKVQDDEVGDGTTSVVVLAGELLKEAEKLINMKIHPMTIIAGYRMALECARDTLLQKTMDNKDNTDKFRADLMNIAMTTLSSKILSQDKEYFAELAVDACLPPSPSRLLAACLPPSPLCLRLAAAFSSLSAAFSTGAATACGSMRSGAAPSSAAPPSTSPVAEGEAYG